MIKRFFKHKVLLIVLLLVAILFTEGVYFYVDAQPDPDALTIGFVDAMPSTVGFENRICAFFQGGMHLEKVRSIYCSRITTDSYIVEGVTAAQTLSDYLLGDSVDFIILDQFNLQMLAEAGLLAAVPNAAAPMTQQEAELVTVDGVCYGIVIDGADLTGQGDVFFGYKPEKQEEQQYYCAAVLNGSNNVGQAIEALYFLQSKIVKRD